MCTAFVGWKKEALPLCTIMTETNRSAFFQKFSCERITAGFFDNGTNITIRIWVFDPLWEFISPKCSRKANWEIKWAFSLKIKILRCTM